MVITVIILLILAGITINMTIGQNGIIKRAQEAKENMIQASKEEEEMLNRLFGKLEGENGSNGGGSASGDDNSNATEREILTGYKAYSGGKLLTGTMPNRGAISQTLNAGESYPIPEGYHNGEGVVTAKDLASQTEATATASDIAEGKTAWVNGENITGTLNGIRQEFFKTLHNAIYQASTKVAISTSVTYTASQEEKIYAIVIGVVDRSYNVTTNIVGDSNCKITQLYRTYTGGTQLNEPYKDIQVVSIEMKLNSKITFSATREQLSEAHSSTVDITAILFK